MPHAEQIIHVVKKRKSGEIFLFMDELMVIKIAPDKIISFANKPIRLVSIGDTVNVGNLR
jgi:hypothetical protein